MNKSNKPALKEKIKNIPASPGVYIFLDKNKKPLYVGKAINLKNRVKSYFTRSFGNSRFLISKMLDKISKIDFKETESEIEALILESQLIKRLKPRFNIVMRDDKQYFYVGITREDFPKIFLTHQMENRGKAQKITYYNFIGPFTDGRALKTTLKLLRRAFPYCTCKQKHHNPCLNYHIDNCPGFCCLKSINKKQITGNKKIYQKNIRAIRDILEGKRIAFVKKLKKEMLQEARGGNLEKAIKLRFQLEKLKRVFENAKIIRRYSNKSKHEKRSLKELRKIFGLPKIPHRIEGYDVSNIQGKNATGSMAVFTDGQPDKNEYRKFRIRTKKTPDDIAMLKEILIRRFNHPEWPYPDLIFVDGGKGQLNAASKAIKNKFPIISLAKGKNRVFSTTLKKAVPMAQLPDNIQNLIKYIDFEAHRFAISYHRKLRKKFI